MMTAGAALTLLHLANHQSTNIGNGALIDGTERVLREDLGNDLLFHHEPWDDYTLSGGTRRFDRTFVDLVNGADALLVGGAVTMNGSTKYRHAGMRLDLPSDLWTRIARPVIFYGISCRIWPGQKYHHLQRLRHTMETLLGHPRVLIGTRNDGTKGWLESVLGYTTERIIAIPDPALYVPVTDAWHPELIEGKVNILIALNNEDEVYRFGGAWRERAWECLAPFTGERVLRYAWRHLPRWDEHRRRFLRRLASAVARLAADYDVNLILCPHYYEDYAMLGDFVAACPPRPLHRLLISSPLLGVPRTPYFYDLYAKADVVLSMRVHSMSPAIGLGTPVVPLVSQPRMREFLHDTGLEDLAVEAFDPDMTERVYELVKRILAAPERMRARLAEARGRMRERTRAFNQQVAALLA